MLRDALAAYGLEGDDEIDAIRTLRSGLHGFVALERSGGFRQPRDTDATFARIVASLDAVLTQWRR